MSKLDGTLGQICYEAWRAEIGSSSLLSWAELGEPVRQAWYAASVAVVEATWKRQHKAMVARWKEQERESRKRGAFVFDERSRANPDSFPVDSELKWPIVAKP